MSCPVGDKPCLLLFSNFVFNYPDIVGQGRTVLAIGAGGGCLDILSLVYYFSLLSPSLWETA